MRLMVTAMRWRNCFLTTTTASALMSTRGLALICVLLSIPMTFFRKRTVTPLPIFLHFRQDPIKDSIVGSKPSQSIDYWT